MVIHDISIGNGSTSASDDTDFNATVTFTYKDQSKYEFRNIFFDNSVHNSSEKTEFSVLMFYDEMTKLQVAYNEILMTSDVTNKGDVYDFEMKIPENDTSVGISFTRREPI